MAKRKGGKFLKVLGKNYLDAERDKHLTSSLRTRAEAQSATAITS